MSLFWRYIDAVDDRGGNGENWDSYNYIDLAGTWQITDRTAVRLGINNILDEDPPFSSNVGNAPGNGNVFPGSYDSLGTYFFAGISLEL